MTSFVGGQFLILKAFCPHGVFGDFANAAITSASAAGGAVMINSLNHAVTAMEPGSVPCHLWVLWLPDGVQAEDMWTALSALEETKALHAPIAPIVLAANGIPASGLGPDIPTEAIMDTETDPGGPAYFLVEGTGRDQDRMDQYRDILLPMMVERGAYYTAFELGGDVRVLSGKWDEAIFAISRWPGRDRAIDCWTHDRYQRDAIPLRLDIGSFSVLLTEGA